VSLLAVQRRARLNVVDFAQRRLLMVLSFSDRQIEVRLGDEDLEDEDELFACEIGKEVIGRSEDLSAAISTATSLPRDVVDIELGRAFPIAVQRSGGTSGEIYLRRRD
jgi:hypothetical protein